MPERLTILEFIKRAKEVHGNKYSYERSLYVNTKENVEIICERHGSFFQLPGHHLNGSNCPKCSRIDGGSGKAKREMAAKTYIQRAFQVHNGKYTYERANYIASNKTICVTCPVHGDFFQNANNHVNGATCPKCRNELRTITQEEFIKRSNLAHYNKYDYSKTIYKHNKLKIIIICPRHGEFEQRANSHLKGEGCHKCVRSKGEEKVAKFLNENNIEYKSHHRFETCKNEVSGRRLSFDFFLPNHNIAIEYDGEQHFKPARLWYKNSDEAIQNLEGVQARDKIRDLWTKESREP